MGKCKLNQPFSPQVPFVMVLHHRNSSPKTRPYQCTKLIPCYWVLVILEYFVFNIHMETKPCENYICIYSLHFSLFGLEKPQRVEPLD